MIICDIETRGLEATYDTSCEVVLIGMLDTNEGKAKVCNLSNFPKYLDMWGNREWCFHNAKFDLQVLLCHLPNFKEYFYTLPIHDTQVMAYCLNSSDKGYSLDKLSEKYLGHKKVEVKDWQNASLELLVQRNIKDLQLTAALFEVLSLQLQQDELAMAQYLNIELPYVKLIALMEQAGAPLDKDALSKLHDELEQEVAELEVERSSYFYSFRSGTTKFMKNEQSEYLPLLGKWNTTLFSNVKGERKYARTELDIWNPNSSEQNALVLQHLYPKYEFNFRQTKAGKLTVNSDELRSYEVPLSETVRKHVDAEQKLSSFTRPMKERLRDGRIYGSFNQTITRTGRLSSSNPNLQNIPRKGEKGKAFRKLFKAQEGFKLVVGDLDRIEIVVLAHYLKTLGFSDYMAEAIEQGVDVHTANTKQWFDLTGEEEDFGSWRDIAKTIIFAIIYGAGAKKVESKLKLGLKKTKELISKVEVQLNLVEYKEYVAQSARHQGGVLHTVLGRRLVIPELLSNDQEEYASGFRKVNNYLIQGSAGDIFKELQLRAYYEEAFKEFQLSFYKNYAPLIVVHDEAVYEAHDWAADNVAGLLTGIYSAKDILSIPINCQFNVGDTWAEAKG
jgi:DNA polymerase-1